MSDAPTLQGSRVGRRSGTALILGSFALALAPKCPLCLWAYFGALGSAGVVSTAWGAWLAPLTITWLTFTVGTLMWRAGERRGPAVLGLVAAITILVARFRFEHRLMLYAGMAALLIAAAWRAWPTSRCSRLRNSEVACERIEPVLSRHGLGRRRQKLRAASIAAEARHPADAGRPAMS